MGTVYTPPKRGFTFPLTANNLLKEVNQSPEALKCPFVSVACCGQSVITDTTMASQGSLWSANCMLVIDKSLWPWQLYMLSAGSASCAITVHITIYGVVNCNKLAFSCF